MSAPTYKQPQEAQPPSQNIQQSSLSGLIPSRIIEPWMAETIDARRNEIPLELRDRMKNPYIEAAVAHILKNTEKSASFDAFTSLLSLLTDPNSNERQFPAILSIAKDTSGKATDWAISFFQLIIKSGNFSENWLNPQSNSYILPGLALMVNKILKNIPEDAASKALDFAFSLLNDCNFKESWIHDYWNPIFDLMAQNTDGAATAGAFSAMYSLQNNKNFREQCFPTAISIVSSTAGAAIPNAFMAFSSFLSNKNFQENWVNDYWVPMFEHALRSEKQDIIFPFLSKALASGEHPSKILDLLRGEKTDVPFQLREYYESIVRLNPISEFSGNPAVVWQGQGAFLTKEGAAQGLYTFNLGNCSAVVAVSKDKSKPMVAMAHVDPLMDGRAIASFFDRFSDAGSVELAIIGGSKKNSERIRAISENYPNVSVSIFIYDLDPQNDAVAVSSKGTVYYGGIPLINSPANEDKAKKIDTFRSNGQGGMPAQRGMELVDVN